MKKKIKLNNPEIGLYIVLALLPFEMIFSAIGLGLYFFLVFFNYKIISSIKFQIKHNSLVLLPSLYFIVVLLGLLYTPLLNEGFSRLNAQLSLLVIPLLIMFSNLKLSHIRTAKKIFLYACIIFCCLSLITLLYNYIDKYHYRYHYNFVQSSMYHFHFPYDALYINFAYLILLFGKYSTRLKSIIALLFFTVILMFGVRVGLFSFLIISLVYFVLNFKSFFKIRSLIYLLLLMVVCFYTFKTSKYVSDKYYDTLDKIGFNTKANVSKIGVKYHKISEREALWSSSLELIKQKPYLGYGTARHQEVLDALYVVKACKSCINKNSHNQYLSSLVNFGFFGFIILLFVLVYSLILAVKMNNIQFVLFLFLVGLAFVTETVLVRQKGVMFFSLFLALFLREYKLHCSFRLNEIKKTL